MSKFQTEVNDDYRLYEMQTGGGDFEADLQDQQGAAAALDMTFDLEAAFERYGEYDDSHALRGRDVRREYDNRGESRMSGAPKSKAGKRNGSVEAVFKRRMAAILHVREREVPELFVNQPTKTVRANALRMDAVDAAGRAAILTEALDDQGIDSDPLEWLEGAQLFDAPDTFQVQAMPLTQKGGAFIQNPSSFLPVLALDVEPGQSILDMCSAPGGKASLIAAMTGNQAELTVNEPKGRRMQRLREVMTMMGVETAFRGDDAKHLPKLLGHGMFDRILVDAECSTEAGINFESRDPLEGWSEDRITRLSRLQTQLATAAFDLLRPGGIMVYSTCSLAPEENEGVITELLHRREDAILQPVRFAAEPNAPKVKTWKDLRFPSTISDKVLRIQPTDHMEGFFVARIRKPFNSTVPVEMTEEVSLDDIAKKGL